MSRTKIVDDLEKLNGHLLDEATQNMKASVEKHRDSEDGYNYPRDIRATLRGEARLLRRISQTIELIIENNSSGEDS